MNAITPTQRDRGLQRLRRLTVGAATGATMALLGISYVAAASYAGKTSSSTALNSSSSTTSAATTPSSSATASATSSPSTQASTSSASTGSTGSGTVTTGGS